MDTNDRIMVRCTAKKLKAIEILGCVCKACNKNLLDTPWCCEFHHIDPTDKEDDITNLITKTWDTVKQEIMKCILLCSNCHREIHFNKERLYKYKDVINELKNTVDHWQSPKNILTDEDKELITTLHNNGETTFAISKKLNVTRKVIKRYFKLNNIKPNKVIAEKLIIPKEVISDLISKGWSIGKIAKHLNTTHLTIRRKIILYKLKYKTKSKFSHHNLELN